MPTRVRDVMSTEIRTVGPMQPLRDVVDLLRRQHVRHVPVVGADGRLLGLLTNRDLVGRALGPISWFGAEELERQLGEMRAREVMTDELVTIGPDALLSEAASTMLAGKYGCLPVVEEGRLVGILTESDFVRMHAG